MTAWRVLTKPGTSRATFSKRKLIGLPRCPPQGMTAMTDTKKPEQTPREIIAKLAAMSPEELNQLMIGKYFKPAWKPIETAPRDGTKILVWHPEVQGIALDRQAGAAVDEWKNGRWWRSYPA